MQPDPQFGEACLEGEVKDQPGHCDAVGALDESGHGTKVVRHYKTVVIDQSAFITRTSDAGFNFVSFTGTETNAVIQFVANGEHVAMFALGCDRNGDGLLLSTDGEIGPAFGVYDRNFRIQEVNLGTNYDDRFNQGGGDGNSGDDWYRLQLRLNFAAGNGEGIGSLYFKNLTGGDTTFHTVPGVTNRPLGLRRMYPDTRPAKWRALWLHLLCNGNSVPSPDNQVPNLNGIRLTEIVHTGTNVVLRWRGGVGPYQVQRRAGLDAGNWENAGSSTALKTAMAAIVDETGSERGSSALFSFDASHALKTLLAIMQGNLEECLPSPGGLRAASPCGSGGAASVSFKPGNRLTRGGCAQETKWDRSVMWGEHPIYSRESRVPGCVNGGTISRLCNHNQENPMAKEKKPKRRLPPAQRRCISSSSTRRTGFALTLPGESTADSTGLTANESPR